MGAARLDGRVVAVALADLDLNAEQLAGVLAACLPVRGSGRAPGVESGPGEA